MMICVGGVCVPLNLLIPFLVGLLHRYGYLQWFKQEWVTLRWWKKQWTRWVRGADAVGGKRDAELAARAADKGRGEDEQRVEAAVDAAVQQHDSHSQEAQTRRRRGARSSEEGA